MIPTLSVIVLLAALLWLLTSDSRAAQRRPPLLAGERPWHATYKNPVNRNLLRIARCETGGKRGQNGRPDWDHRARSEHAGLDYVGALGFLETTWWDRYRRIRPTPPRDGDKASPGEQLAMGRALVREFQGYSSWPACSVRLGLR